MKNKEKEYKQRINLKKYLNRKQSSTIQTNTKKPKYQSPFCVYFFLIKYSNVYLKKQSNVSRDAEGKKQ